MTTTAKHGGMPNEVCSAQVYERDTFAILCRTHLTIKSHLNDDTPPARSAHVYAFGDNEDNDDVARCLRGDTTCWRRISKTSWPL